VRFTRIAFFLELNMLNFLLEILGYELPKGGWA